MPQGRALLVDEDPLVRLAVDRQLYALGWDALVVNNGSEALRILEARHEVDVILMELRLPDLDGRIVADIAARLAPAARILFMSGERPVRPVGRPVLVKPFSTWDLARALDGAGGNQPR